MTGNEPIKNRRDFVWVTLIMLTSVAVLFSFGIVYINHEMSRADQRWCDLFIGLDDNYRAAPPGSLPQRQQRFANQIHQLRRDLHCAKTPQPTIQPIPSQSK